MDQVSPPAGFHLHYLHRHTPRPHLWSFRPAIHYRTLL